jgi:hypothetical protein
MLDSQSADSLLPEDNILVGHAHDLRLLLEGLEEDLLPLGQGRRLGGGGGGGRAGQGRLGGGGGGGGGCAVPAAPQPGGGAPSLRAGGGCSLAPTSSLTQPASQLDQCNLAQGFQLFVAPTWEKICLFVQQSFFSWFGGRMPLILHFSFIQ